jgi:adenosylcobyric acid synthase
VTKKAAAVMVCGTTSSAGKTFLVTALARWYARQGLRVAPFKAQNMSNNARVVADGEMGSAQYFQALAARCVPDVRMNPVLVKPEKDTQSQVIVLGRRDGRLSTMEWRERSEYLWPIVQRCLAELMASHDVVVIEGAGSPAEINLRHTDIVNMRVAEAVQAATILICDIDRGGAFAHLYGTHQLLPESARGLIRGFVLNKFRGDRRLLSPGPQMLESLTGVPTLGVLPMWREHGLPEEDGVFDAKPSARGLSIVVVAYPRISNLDEFTPLRHMPGVSLSWARETQTVASAELLILPGSKHVAEDLAWLRQTGLEKAIMDHVKSGKPTLAICGGLQILGRHLSDPHGVEGEASGLGILALSTEFQASKRYEHRRYAFGALEGFWAPLGRVSFDAYQIRHGHTEPAICDDLLRPVLPDGCGWQSGEILALYTHGLFENPAVVRALFGQEVPTLDDTFEGLADFIERHMGADTLTALLTSNGVPAI